MNAMSHERLDHLKRFYALLAVLEETSGGARRLSDCSGRMNWPTRGIYFYQEPNESRSDTGDGKNGKLRGPGRSMFVSVVQERCLD